MTTGLPSVSIAHFTRSVEIAYSKVAVPGVVSFERAGSALPGLVVYPRQGV